MKNYVATLAIAITLALPQAARAQGVTSLPVPDKGPAIGFRALAVSLDVNPDALTLRPVKGARAATQQGGRRRSKKRIIAGAIVGSVGGFFAGGFLGAHIEGDRCDCDDPGVRGFLIGAPIGALAGGIFGARFLF